MTTSDDRIASYSSRGPTNIDLIAKPDVVAPGNLVDSLLAPGSTLVNDYPGNVLPASAYTTAAFRARRFISH
jgi:serine protease AprX